MAQFFRSSTIWVVDYLYKGRARRWFKALAADADAAEAVSMIAKELAELYGRDARLAELRKASVEEERQYRRGELPVQSFCPTGR